jgi:hypothetical protein
MTLETPPSPFSTTSVPAQTSSLAIVSVISGIASWFVLPLIGAIIAVITGHMAKKEIRESAGRLGGAELADAGLVLGYIHLALSVLGICLALMVVALCFLLIISTVGWSHAYIRIIPW